MEEDFLMETSDSRFISWIFFLSDAGAQTTPQDDLHYIFGIRRSQSELFACHWVLERISVFLSPTWR